MSSRDLCTKSLQGLYPRTHLCLFFALLSFLCNAQIVEIGTGSTLHQGLPIEPLARFSYTQQLFFSSQIALSGVINQISFQYHVQSSSFYSGNKEWKIFIGHTLQSQMQGWIPISQLSLVYDGILQQDYFSAGLPGSGWLTIPLQEPFSYNGNDNLIIAVDENTDGSGTSSDDFFCTQMTGIRALNFQSLTVNPDPEDPPETFNNKTYLSNIRLRFGSGTALEAPQNLYGYYAEGAARLFWEAPQSGIPEAYVILRNGAELTETSSLHHADQTVSSGNNYSYNVRARNAAGELSLPSNTIQVDVPISDPDIFLFESFESLNAFSQNIPGFINLDLDQSPTWGWENVDYPQEGSPLAWLVFSPAHTQPPLTTVSAYSGGKMLVSMSAVNPPNNDWLILPNIRPGTSSSFSFWARSLTSAYGLERLRVLISTGDANPASFSSLSGGAYLSVPAVWTQYEFDLSSYAEQDVYLAVNCVSLDAFALFVDDLELSGDGGHLDVCEQIPMVPRPHPNPGKAGFSIKSESHIDVSVYNLRGQHLGSQNGIRDFRSDTLRLGPGLYLVKVKTAEATKVFKQVILP